ncbi:hypothetical protein [Pseudomonas sp. CCOS 191]|uniref:hypothetical protein n=1 Tax=Pseudomonas sp. CCOS 191 TaxID=1649877 RepID=UPI0012E08332|nr:hypothetical protein [Pseudomonas sp. CCOS 191]
MIELRGIYTALLWAVLVLIVSGCSASKTDDVTPSANDLRVYFYSGLWGGSGLLCSIAVPDNGTAPICPEVLKVVDEDSCHVSEEWCEKQGKEYVPYLLSIAFGYWQGFHVVCLQTAQDVDVLCVDGRLPDDNKNARTIAHMRSVYGFPEFLQPLEVTHWDKQLLGKITKIRGWRFGR